MPEEMADKPSGDEALQPQAQDLVEARYDQDNELIPVDTERSGGLAGAALLGGAGAAAVGAGYLYYRWSTGRSQPMSEALPAPRHAFLSEQAGHIAYYADVTKTGRPLVLVHSVNAAAGAHEMRPLFEHYQRQRPLFALDLPGYGFSDRSKRALSPDLFAGVLADFLRRIVREPADIVALSLGCEFAARSAQIEPGLVNSLVLISPSGFSQKASVVQGLAGSHAVGGVTHATLALPVLSQALFDGITTESSIRYYLRKSFVNEPPAWLLEYAHATAHQPGAKHAPLYFLSGLLFTPDAHANLYPGVQQPVLVIHDEDPYVNFEMLPEVAAAHANWQVRRITPTLGMPHWEKLDETVAAMETFWQSAHA